MDRKTLEKIFQSCSFAAAGQSSGVVKSLSAEHDSITSFFVDSSGRSNFIVPLELKFSTRKDIKKFLIAKCFDPPPRCLVSDFNSSESEDGNDDLDSDGDEKIPKNKSRTESSPTIQNLKCNASIAFDIESTPSERDDSNQVTVEGVSILSCFVKKFVVTFKTKVTVRATTSESCPASIMTSMDSSTQTSPSCFYTSLGNNNVMQSHDELEVEPKLPPQKVNVSTSFKITPVLTINCESIFHHRVDMNKSGVSKNDFCPDLTRLELAAIPDHMQYSNDNKPRSQIFSTSDDRVHETRLSPVSINVTLTNAFIITVQSVSGRKSQMGNNLVSLSIQHSRTHNMPVTITNIAVHPGHSRRNLITVQNSKTIKNDKVGEPPKIHNTVFNMTESVEWGYAPKTGLKLPLTLLPYEAYSSIICIKAGEERNSRQFLSPLSVTGVIKLNTNIKDEHSEEKVGDNGDRDGQEHCRVVVASDTYWTTKLIAVEPADAFRIDMCTIESTVQRGEPMVIKFRIFNLSLESRNLMIFMAKKDHSSSSRNKNFAVKEESVNTAVVNESEGYTFGVWGVSSDDDGTVRLNRDHELLAIDTALVLGEVQGQHAVNAELRFIPLRLGRLKVPNWKLYDKSANQWYSCTHDLNILAV